MSHVSVKTRSIAVSGLTHSHEMICRLDGFHLLASMAAELLLKFVAFVTMPPDINRTFAVKKEMFYLHWTKN